MEFKRGILICLLAVIIILPDWASAALGISPAIVEINFKPGEEYVINYKVLSDSPDKEILVSSGGDLAQYVEISKDKLIGGGSFTAILRMPDKIDKPGEHRIGIGVKEKPPENKFIGTAIEIYAAIKIFVPYPGRYAEAELNIVDGNIDEEIPVDIKIINKGKEDLNVNAYIKFSNWKSDNIYTILFEPFSLNSTEERHLRGFLNTTGYRPGDYLAEAVINYGGEIKINKTFRIGSLFVNITNFTTEMQEGGIQRFLIELESKWNGDLRDVYADVNVSNSTKTIAFRTPSIELTAWSKGILEGFLDTTGMRGEYKVDINLNYMGGRSSASGHLNVLRRGLSSTIYIIGALAIVIILIIVFIIFAMRRMAFRRRLR